MCCELETKRKISKTGGKVNKEETASQPASQPGVGGGVGGWVGGWGAGGKNNNDTNDVPPYFSINFSTF